MNALIDSSPAIWLTFKLAAMTVIILLSISLPLAWWLARYQGKLKPVFEALIALPLVLPPTVLGFYLLTAFSPDTVLGGLWANVVGEQFVFTFSGILFGSIVYSLPFVMQPLLAGFSQLDKQTSKTISTLGIAPLKGFIFIILPIVRPSIIGAATLGFAHTLGEFGLILMIGGNIPGETQVVSIALFNQVESLQYQQAHALSLFLLVVSLVSLTLLYKFNRHARLFPAGN
jgi:molybdate transport system permease protein